MILDLFRYFIGALLLVLLQHLVINEVRFGADYLEPMPYIYLLLIIPFYTNRYVQLIFAFLMGFSLDVLNNTQGMNSAACVFLVYAKVYSENNIIDKEAIELQGANFVSLHAKGFRYYASYIGILIFIHHLVYFSLDYFKFSQFFTILLVSLLSTISTFVLIQGIRILMRHQ